jgi:drug/metabolite transporter (DMT)-like permease
MSFALILVSICILFAAAGQILMKTGMRQIGEITNVRQLFDFSNIFSMFTNIYVVIGILCFASMIVLWLAAMSTLNISRMYPLTSLVYVITAIVAFIFLKEDISLLRWVGILMVVAGCFLVGLH